MCVVNEQFFFIFIYVSIYFKPHSLRIKKIKNELKKSSSKNINEAKSKKKIPQTAITQRPSGGSVCFLVATVLRVFFPLLKHPVWYVIRSGRYSRFLWNVFIKWDINDFCVVTRFSSFTFSCVFAVITRFLLSKRVNKCKSNIELMVSYMKEIKFVGICYVNKNNRFLSKQASYLTSFCF